MADASFDMTRCHLRRNLLEVFVDLDVSDTSLEERPSLQSSNLC